MRQTTFNTWLIFAACGALGAFSACGSAETEAVATTEGARNIGPAGDDIASETTPSPASSPEAREPVDEVASTSFAVWSHRDNRQILMGKWDERGLSYRNPDTSETQILGQFDGTALTTPSGIVDFTIDDSGRVVNADRVPYEDPGATIQGRDLTLRTASGEVRLQLNSGGELVNIVPSGEQRIAAHFEMLDGGAVGDLEPRSTLLAYFILAFFEIDRVRFGPQ